jgi:uncharacterized protein
MPDATFRFYADLNELLPNGLQQVAFAYPFNEPQSVKHLIESVGVPHTEVAIILANGGSVGFDYQVRAGDRISVYPVFSTIDVSPLHLLQPTLNGTPRFLLDNHLGKLARYLRLLGFDTSYPRDHLSDAVLAQLAHDEQRVMLTRDRGLLMRNVITYGYCLRTKEAFGQLTAVLHRYHLHDQIRPWTRCLRCNGLLEPVAKKEIYERLESKTKLYFHQFHICKACAQLYWKGSHFQALSMLIKRVQGLGLTAVKSNK